MLIRQGVLYTFDQKEKEQKEQWQAAISNKWPFMASASKVWHLTNLVRQTDQLV